MHRQNTEYTSTCFHTTLGPQYIHSFLQAQGGTMTQVLAYDSQWMVATKALHQQAPQGNLRHQDTLSKQNNCFQRRNETPGHISLFQALSNTSLVLMAVLEPQSYSTLWCSEHSMIPTVGLHVGLTTEFLQIFMLVCGLIHLYPPFLHPFSYLYPFSHVVVSDTRVSLNPSWSQIQLAMEQSLAQNSGPSYLSLTKGEDPRQASPHSAIHGLFYFLLINKT